MNNNTKYNDIINLQHHISKKHKPMSLKERAAQFASFAALTGYEDAIIETGRITKEKIELDEEQKKILNRKIQQIKKELINKPCVTFTYFIPDIKKSGGKYITATGNVVKIDEYRQKVILEDKTEIFINNIIDIEA